MRLVDVETRLGQPVGVHLTTGAVVFRRTNDSTISGLHINGTWHAPAARWARSVGETASATRSGRTIAA